MKKTTIILAGLALIAASCAKTEVVSSGPEGGEKGISFSAYTARPTKAQDEVTTNNLTSFQATAIGSNSVYFDNVTFNKVTTNKGTTSWESNPAYFWPNYSLTFCAYNTPGSNTGFTKTLTPAEQSIAVTPASALANQEDLVAAYANDKSETDVNSNKAIDLKFNHYLTQVIVKAKSSNSNYTVKVDGIKLANLAGDGKYTFSDNKMTASNEKVNSASSTDYSETFNQKTLTSEAQEVMTDAGNGRWYLIPQTVTAWDQANNKKNTSSEGIAGNGTYLALKVLITSKGGANIYPYSGTTSSWMAVPVPSGLAFAQGKKYNVTVDFFSTTGNGGAGYVDPEDPGELDGDSTTNDAGKKIIGGVIKFSATVNTWGDSVDITISL